MLIVEDIILTGDDEASLIDLKKNLVTEQGLRNIEIFPMDEIFKIERYLC